MTNIAGSIFCLEQFYKIFFFLSVAASISATSKCQLTISGVVYDSTGTIPVKNVAVQSTNGTTAVTDSSGHYVIVSTDNDSLLFLYGNKPTAKFSVKQIADIGNFDISLHIRLSEKFRTLKEVRVYSRSFKQDSMENRERYARFFDYDRPGLQTGTDAYTGAAGLDLDELINAFRFKRNRRFKQVQAHLLEQEHENYINYRFNKATVRRITRLQGNELDTFMKEYRPDFEFTRQSSIVEFYQYILTASYRFKQELLMQQAKKEKR